MRYTYRFVFGNCIDLVDAKINLLVAGVADTMQCIGDVRNRQIRSLY